MTKREAFEIVINAIDAGVLEAPEVKEVLVKEVERLNSKNSKAKVKADAAHIEEEGRVLDYFPEGSVTVTEIAAAIPEMPYSTSKVTAILKRLVAYGYVKNEKVGKKSLYTKVEGFDAVED